MKPVVMKYTEIDVSNMQVGRQKGENKVLGSPKSFDDFCYDTQTGDYDNLDAFMNKPTSTSIANLMMTTKETHDYDMESFFSLSRKSSLISNFDRTSKTHNSFSHSEMNPHFKLKHNCMVDSTLKSNLSSPILANVRHGKIPVTPTSSSPLSLKRMYNRPIAQSFNDLCKREFSKNTANSLPVGHQPSSCSFRRNLRNPNSSSHASPNDNVSIKDQLDVNKDISNNNLAPKTEDPIKILSRKMFQLEGFTKEDVAKQINKPSEYSKKLGKEYLLCFDFGSIDLVQSLRSFLNKIVLCGETQERERILYHFSTRYFQCNSNMFKTEDSCHSLTCAIILLNTDLYGQNIGKKMSQQSFINNLKGLNEGSDFPMSLLKAIYQSVSKKPLPFEKPSSIQHIKKISHGSIQNNDAAKLFKGMIFKRGFIMRKAHLDADGRRTPFRKRRWKIFFATLSETTLFLHKDSNDFTKEISDDLHDLNPDSLKILHSLASKPEEYEKPFVFQLKLANWAVYLFQLSTEMECQQWMEAINLAASCFSAPALPGAVGSQMTFTKPLLPTAPTKLNLREQMKEHEKNRNKFELELASHNSSNLKGRDFEMQGRYLAFEFSRYCAYVDVLKKNYIKLKDTERFSTVESNQRLKSLKESSDTFSRGVASNLCSIKSAPAIIFETRV